jgi:hypothetical protein
LKSHAPYFFTLDELNILLSRLGLWKLPTNYGALLPKHMLNKKLGSMKTHHYHLLMQQFLPMCLCGLMAMELWMAIMQLNRVFQ